MFTLQVEFACQPGVIHSIPRWNEESHCRVVHRLNHGDLNILQAYRRATYYDKGTYYCHTLEEFETMLDLSTTADNLRFHPMCQVIMEWLRTNRTGPVPKKVVDHTNSDMILQELWKENDLEQILRVTSVETIGTAIGGGNQELAEYLSIFSPNTKGGFRVCFCESALITPYDPLPLPRDHYEKITTFGIEQLEENLDKTDNFEVSLILFPIYEVNCQYLRSLTSTKNIELLIKKDHLPDETWLEPEFRKIKEDQKTGSWRKAR